MIAIRNSTNQRTDMNLHPLEQFRPIYDCGVRFRFPERRLFIATLNSIKSTALNSTAVFRLACNLR